MDVNEVRKYLHVWHDKNLCNIREEERLLQLDAEISARTAECGWWMLCKRRKIARLRQICESYSGEIKRNKKTADDLGLILLANTGILDVHSEYRTRYRPQAYRDAAEHLANDPARLLTLLELSLDTDPGLLKAIQRPARFDPDTYWMGVIRHYPRLDGTMLPPTQWGYECSIQAYRKNQVRTIPQGVRLLRTLQYGKTTNEKALLDFKVGQEIWIGPGLSTTATKPHGLGQDVVWIIRGVERGVPLVGIWDDPQTGLPQTEINEKEVFIPDQLKCRITSTALDPHDKLEIGNRQPYQLTVIDSRTPDNMHHQGE